MMTKADKKMVIAANFSQAKHYAQAIMGWDSGEWQFVRKRGDLDGMHSILLFDVRAPKYRPTPSEASRIEELRIYIPILQEAGRVAKLNVYNLPA